MYTNFSAMCYILGTIILNIARATIKPFNWFWKLSVSC